MSRAKATILCIDDHWKGLIARKMLLENNGYEVLEASGVDEGLKLFVSRNVEAVVLDYQMPGTIGDVVAEKMKRINSHVPIMLLSAYGPLPKSKLRAVDSFLTKITTAGSSLIQAAGSAGRSTKTFFLPLAQSMEQPESGELVRLFKLLLRQGCTHRFSWPRIDENGRRGRGFGGPSQP